MPKKPKSDTLRQNESRCRASRLMVFLEHHIDVVDDGYVQGAELTGVLHAVHQVEAVLQHLLVGRKLLEVGSGDLVL
eukprot:10092959-Heterocapsa_arctica.AAC.1